MVKKIVLLLLLIPAAGKGQSLSFRRPIAQVCPDREGNFLVLLKCGVIQKYSDAGVLLAKQKKKGVTSIDASVDARIFYFKKKKKRIGWLSPNLEFLEEKKIDDLHALEPELACPLSLSEWWVADAASRHVRRIDSKSGAVRAEFSMEENFAWKKMAYHSQYLFISCENKTRIYDFLGHFVNDRNGGNVNFWGEEFYVLQDHYARFYNLYSNPTRDIPIESNCWQILFLENQKLEIFQKKIIISPFKQ